MKIDGRENNYGEASRRQWTSKKNAELIDEVTESVNQVLAKYPKDYFRNVRKLSPSKVELRRNLISKCSKDYYVLMQDVMVLKNK